MLDISYEKQFKKDYKKAMKAGCSRAKLEKVIFLLASEEELPQAYRDHKLTDSRNYKNARECHIEPDWLLVYQIKKEIELLNLVRTGSHSELFK